MAPSVRSVGGEPRRRAMSDSRAVRRKRRWPPGVVNTSMRPSSAQRRSVSGSTPTSLAAAPRASHSERPALARPADVASVTACLRPPAARAEPRPGAGIWANVGEIVRARAEDTDRRLGVSTRAWYRASRLRGPAGRPRRGGSKPRSAAGRSARPRASPNGRSGREVRPGRTRGRRGGDRRRAPSPAARSAGRPDA